MDVPALWAFEEDIQSRTFWDWLTSHTSFLKPLHRFEGNLLIHPGVIQLAGMDKRTGKESFFEIRKDQIEQFYLGFDKIFSAFEVRGFGLSWLPLRITFSGDGKQRKLYLITNYRWGRSANQECFDFLRNWLSE